jgi:excinuclease ABC subunit B
MYEGDMSRKRALVDHGFRLPSAMDNRPLRWEEFLERIGQTVYLSATPGAYELAKGDGVVEQIIRPTGLVDPEVVVKPTKGQIDDLLHEIRDRADRHERVLVTTLTKKMAEDLTDYMLEHGVRVRYLHSEVDTLRRVELLRELRMGEYETIGRAARNVSGQVHMYADTITPSMAQAIDETNRRREKQVAYNRANGVDPTPLRKRIADITDLISKEDADTAALLGGSGRQQSRGKAPVPGLRSRGEGTSSPRLAELPAADLADLIQQLSDQMHAAAAELQFELAARLRDEIGDLKKELRGMQAAGHA